ARSVRTDKRVTSALFDLQREIVDRSEAAEVFLEIYRFECDRHSLRLTLPAGPQRPRAPARGAPARALRALAWLPSTVLCDRGRSARSKPARARSRIASTAG